MSIIRLFMLYMAFSNLWNLYCTANPHVSIKSICGTYQHDIEATNSGYEVHNILTINDDYSYTLHQYEKQPMYDQPFDNTNTKAIQEVRRLNKDIVYIKIANDPHLITNKNGELLESDYCKHKDAIGTFIRIKVPSGKLHYNLSIPEELGLSAGYVFSEDGYYHYCTNIYDCNDSEDNFFQYVDNGGVIYSLAPWKEGIDDEYILFEKVQDGLFQEYYTKVEE